MIRFPSEWKYGAKLAPGRCVTCRWPDRKSTRLNSSHSQISYAVFCLKKKKEQTAELERSGDAYPSFRRADHNRPNDISPAYTRWSVARVHYHACDTTAVHPVIKCSSA